MKCKHLLLTLLFLCNVLPAAFAQNGPGPERQEILFQLKLHAEIMEYLDDLFQKFSEGYMNPGAAQKKVNVLKHSYNKKADPVPKDARALHRLINMLLSRVENYFIYYKTRFRENPGINLKIARTKVLIAREAQRLRLMYR